MAGLTSSTKSTMGSQQSLKTCKVKEVDPHELVLEKAMTDFDEKSCKLQKLLIVDQRYKTDQRDGIKTDQSDTGVRPTSGVSLIQGASRISGKPVATSLNHSSFVRRQKGLVPRLTLGPSQ